MEGYYEAFDVLDYLDIKKVNELDPFKRTDIVRRRNQAYFSSKDHDWVPTIFKAYEKHHELIKRKISSFNGRGLNVTRQVGFMQSRAWDLGDEIFRLYGNITALFPGNTSFESMEFFHVHETDEMGVPIDYMNYLVVLRPFLELGFCHLYPSRINWYDYRCGNGGLSTILRREVTDKNVNISANGHSFNSISSLDLNSLNNPSMEIFSRFPWLPNCDAENYSELISENMEAFNLYIKALDNLQGREGFNEIQFINTIKDIEYGIEKIDFMHKNLKNELNSKGANVFLGSSLAVGCFFLPENFSDYKEIFGLLASGKTASDAISWLDQSKNLKKTLEHENYWYLWNWSKG